MKKFALIGKPISHSQSPKLFKEAFPDGDMTYDLLERDTVEESVAELKANGYCGANVTSPFKESVMQFVTNPDETTKTLNAANLILFKSDKGMKDWKPSLPTAPRRKLKSLQNVSGSRQSASPRQTSS